MLYFFISNHKCYTPVLKTQLLYLQHSMSFCRYVDDDDNDNEITDSEATFDVDSYDDRNGRRVESTITFSPDLQTLCDLNLDEACDIINGDEDFNGLNFNLICKAEQAIGQYQDENNRQQASVNHTSNIEHLISILFVLDFYIDISIFFNLYF